MHKKSIKTNRVPMHHDRAEGIFFSFSKTRKKKFLLSLSDRPNSIYFCIFNPFSMLRHFALDIVESLEPFDDYVAESFQSPLYKPVV